MQTKIEELFSPFRIVRLDQNQQFDDQQQQQTTVSCGTNCQRISSQTSNEQSRAAMVFPPQENYKTIGYIESDIPPHIMLNSKQPIQLTTQSSLPTAVGGNASFNRQQIPTMSIVSQSTNPQTQPLTFPPQTTNLQTQAFPFISQSAYPSNQPQTIPYSIYGYRQH